MSSNTEIPFSIETIKFICKIPDNINNKVVVGNCLVCSTEPATTNTIINRFFGGKIPHCSSPSCTETVLRCCNSFQQETSSLLCSSDNLTIRDNNYQDKGDGWTLLPGIYSRKIYEINRYFTLMTDVREGDHYDDNIVAIERCGTFKVVSLKLLSMWNNPQ